ncbi:MAG: hypothetical protein H8E38_14195 [SAR324 cluster bacterium]|nr:hypothetical protein [SAR324 cluster bacterium]MBL7034876.1 hypothetical protein [SAR324 cluster bacterium]
MSRNPEDWRLDEFHAKHKSGVQIWIGNGVFGFHIEKPEYQELNLIEKFRLLQQIKLLKNNINSTA